MKSLNILATKLFIPKSSVQVIQRERLTELLQKSFRHKLTLVSAPAGFGKSTLVSEWLTEQSTESAWYSVDVNDNEPAQFLTYFISALQSIRPNIGKTVLEKLQSPSLTPIESMLTGLINELVSLNTDIVIVLDDYHSIDNERIHGLLTFLIENLPDTIHLLILTRFDPPIPLARMRSQNLVMDIRAEQLAFTYEETSAFCKQIMKKNLTEAKIYKMHNKTEGWVAGLALANLSLKGTQEDKTILKNISGSNRHIVDYLMEEVLNNLPKPITDFLIHTSIFKRFNADLCNVVLQREDSLAFIDKIEAMNTFIFALGDECSWFRYHHLFADLLKQRLKLRIPEEINEYHKQAAYWFDEQGFKQDALYHAFEAKHFSFAAEILEDMAELNWEYGFQSNIFQWIQRLPEEIIQSRIMLNIALAKELMLNGRFEQAVEKFESIESNLQKMLLNKKPDNHNEIIGKIAASRAFLSICSGDIGGIIEHAELALQHLSEKDLIWRGLSASLASIIVCNWPLFKKMPVI